MGGGVVTSVLFPEMFLVNPESSLMPSSRSSTVITVHI